MQNKSFVFFIIIFALFNTFVFSQEYKINNVQYEIQGKTKESYLSNYLNIDTNRIFATEELLNLYLEEINTKLNNLRVIETYTVDKEYVESDFILVNLYIHTVDTKNFIALPYPKYDSNEGFVLKLKLRDSNFFGTLSESNSEILYSYTETKDHKIGVEFDFILPFYLDIFGFNFFSDLESGFYFLEKKFLFDTKTGFEFYIPIQKPFIKYGFIQDAFYNTKKTNYNEWLINENLFVKFPFYFNDFIFSVTTNYNWQILPIYKFYNNVGLEISYNKNNWINNFRKGFILDSNCFINFEYNKFNFYFSTENTFATYFSFNNFAINSRIYAFINPEDNTVGRFFRGITDKYLICDKGFVFNFDIPISIIKINKQKWYDFEVQISPFIDIGFTNNFVFTSGFEVIVFPRITRSLQLRASAGISKEDLELFIGIGLFY